jgi:hypothetical protein
VPLALSGILESQSHQSSLGVVRVEDNYGV